MKAGLVHEEPLGWTSTVDLGAMDRELTERQETGRCFPLAGKAERSSMALPSAGPLGL